MRRSIGIVILLASAAQPAMAQQKQRIGNFTVTTEKDRFGQGATAIALTVERGYMLGVRCLQQELSVAIGDASLVLSHKWQAGESFQIKFRADAKGVLERSAQAI